MENLILENLVAAASKFAQEEQKRLGLNPWQYYAQKKSVGEPLSPERIKGLFTPL